MHNALQGLGLLMGLPLWVPFSEKQMSIDELLNKPPERRWWLLQKALESACLCDALHLARAAEDFLTERQPNLDSSAQGNARPSASTAVLQGNIAAASADTVMPEDRQLAPASRDLLDKKDLAGKAEAVAAAPDDADGTLDRSEEAIGVTDPAGDGLSAFATDFTSWVSSNDVVRYLRQSDDVVVPESDGYYLVNARFHLDLAGLVARANRMRVRKNQPPFSLMPPHFAPLASKGAAAVAAPSSS